MKPDIDNRPTAFRESAPRAKQAMAMRRRPLGLVSLILALTLALGGCEAAGVIAGAAQTLHEINEAADAAGQAVVDDLYAGCEADPNSSILCPGWCDANPTAVTCPGFCDANPGDSSCPGYCEVNPTAYGCPGFCDANPDHYQCPGFCEANPAGRGCPGYCEANPAARDCHTFCDDRPNHYRCITRKGDRFTHPA